MGLTWIEKPVSLRAIEINRVLVLATSHIPEHTDRAICGEGMFDLLAPRGLSHPDAVHHDGMPATMLFPCDAGFYGYLVWADEGFKTMAISERHPELCAVIAFALARGCQWIRFDCDGPEISELPTFTWGD